jgi:formylglycine-generating enzyme required for sulfatase activity
VVTSDISCIINAIAKTNSMMTHITSCILFLIIVFSACKTQEGSLKAEMALVQGGDFIMGSSSKKIDSLAKHYGFPKGFVASEFPPHKVILSTFYIDKFEVTNAQFKDFLSSNSQWQKENIPDSMHNGNYLVHWENGNYPPGTAQYPVFNVTWQVAYAYCEHKAKRLPTEAEWEYAASNGKGNQVYPWGNEPPDSSRANYQGYKGHAVEVGLYPPNDLGLYDMAGNVWEFVLDSWSDDFYSRSPVNNPVNGRKTYSRTELYRINSRRVIRGGSWGGADVNLRNRFRDSHPPLGAGDHVGFRCVKEVTSTSDK